MDDELPLTAESRSAESGTSGRRALRLVGAGLVFVALVLAVYGLMGYLGWRSGQMLRTERIQIEMAEELDRQVTLAQDDIENGRYALALRRLDWVLERRPDASQAQSLRQMAQEQLAGGQTPTPSPSPSPTRDSPTSTPSPIVTRDVAGRLSELEEMVEREAWADAIRGLLEFQTEFPNHERRTSNQLLYDAYLNYGLDLLYSDTVEVGLYYLGRAEALGNLPQEALDQRSYAETYLQGRAFYGADWGLAIAYFRDLCLVAPFYQGACDKLYESLEAYGDQFAFAGESCPAERYYREARQYGRSNDLLQKLETAADACLNATPTPLPTPEGGLTDTIPLTNTFPITTTGP